MIDFETLNKYSNLILAVITLLYVILTWRMVREMRRSREEESAPYLVATLVPLGPMHIKIRIYNAGRGPALNINAEISLEPANGTEKLIWLHPVLIANAHEDFRTPSGEFEFDKLAEKHERLLIQISWQNSFRRTQNATYTFDLMKQKEGWYKAGLLVPPPDISVQLGNIKDELSKIQRILQSEESERHNAAFYESYKREQQLWHRLSKRIARAFTRSKP